MKHTCAAVELNGYIILPEDECEACLQELESASDESAAEINVSESRSARIQH